MWLSIAIFIGTFIKIQGTNFSDENVGHPCVKEILKCEFYRRPFSFDQDKYILMLTNIGDLQKACRSQIAYTQCMARAEEFCKELPPFTMAIQMIKNRRFPAELCRSPSPWQQMYLREANCINAHIRKTSDDCFERMHGIKYMNLATSLKLECAYFKTTADCSAALIQEKCGYYASDIMKRLVMFHYRFDYKCFDFDIASEDDFVSSASNYETTESIFNVFDEDLFHKKYTDSTKNNNCEETTLDYLEDPISENPLLDESADFVHLASNELLQTEAPLPVESDTDVEPEDLSLKQDGYVFPALPQRNYVHKNKTTFALYEDSEMGHMRYVGCGEADFFWVILLSPKNKYCTFLDLRLEYSEAVFKCSVLVDAPCFPELNDEDKQKNGEVFHRRYVITVLNPPNNRMLEEMAVMNVHYLKVFPISPMDGTEKKTNLWSNQEHEDKETILVDRKGPVETEDDPNVFYQYGNGSGQKKDANAMKHSSDSEDDKEYESWDYYPDEDDDDIYFPEPLRNDVIYVEDDNGALISLHDPRSPIYSNSLYRPHYLFRPRIGGIPYLRNLRKWEEKRNIKKEPHQTSIFEESISECKDITSETVNSENQCSSEVPCPSNLELFSKMGIKPGMYIDLQNIKTFDPFKGLKLKRLRPIKSSTNLEDGREYRSAKMSVEAYVVTSSVKIKLPYLKESEHPGKTL